jgi:hypothetical protein
VKAPLPRQVKIRSDTGQALNCTMTPRLVLLSALLLSLAPTPATPLLVTNLTMPTCAAFDAATGVLFVATLGGRLLGVPGALLQPPAQAQAAALVLDLSASVARYRWLGISSIAVARGFLFVAFQATNAAFGPQMAACTDTGAPAGRADADVLGCPTLGVVSRFAVAANASAPGGVTLGAELRVLDAAQLPPTLMCAQFGSHGIAHLLFDAAQTTLFVSAGSGANDNAAPALPDVGQFGGDPCGGPAVGAPAGMGGQLRAQVGASLDGSVVALTGPGLFAAAEALLPVGAAVVARGFANPWRMAWGPEADSVYVIDVGLGEVEELNRVNVSLPRSAAGAPTTAISTTNNFGFPCVNGNGAPLAGFAQRAPCTDPASAAAFVAPRFFVDHPSSAFSALAFDAARGRWLIGDQVRMLVFSVPANLSGALAAESMPLP